AAPRSSVTLYELVPLLLKSSSVVVSVRVVGAGPAPPFQLAAALKPPPAGAAVVPPGPLYWYCVLADAAGTGARAAATAAETAAERARACFAVRGSLREGPAGRDRMFISSE